MKVDHLAELLKAAELGAMRVHHPDQKQRLAEAMKAAMDELKRRHEARKRYRATRPAQTVTRKLIREQLRFTYDGVRLKRSGEWHVQGKPGMSWQLFARNDSEAQELLIFEKPGRKKRHACGCLHHSDAAGVVDACLLGQEQGSDETWTGY
jgi:hypothetical protein